MLERPEGEDIARDKKEEGHSEVPAVEEADDGKFQETGAVGLWTVAAGDV